jgi:WD40 repeat protein
LKIDTLADSSDAAARPVGPGLGASLVGAGSGSAGSIGPRSVDEFATQYLPESGPDAIRAMLRQEIDERRRRGEHPTADEYRIRFAAHMAVIEDLFATAVNDDPQATAAHQSYERSSAGYARDGLVGGAPALRGNSRYRIIKPHAKGGLGEVFIARDEEIDRDVALKEIQARYGDDPDSRARFLKEAEITGKLEHPGIVPVYGLGTYPDGRPYYAMRFIQGDSLGDALERFHDPARKWKDDNQRRLEFRGLLQRFIDVCNAIDYAHSKGVLHRDLKPGNVMLGQYGETLVVDWGLAKRIEDKTPERMSSMGPVKPLMEDSGLTQYGQVLGTPAFMSPEQAAGKLDEMGPATDVYGLGATLYTLLTGEPPFTAGDLESLMATVRKGLPIARYPRKLNRRIPAPLESICVAAMAVKPADRYPTAKRLSQDVENWLADSKVSVHHEGKLERYSRFTRRHRAAVRAVMIVITAITAMGAWMYVDLSQQRFRQSRLDDLQAAKVGFGQTIAALRADRADEDLLALVYDLNQAAEAGASELEPTIRRAIAWHQTHCHRVESMRLLPADITHAMLSPWGRHFAYVAKKRIHVLETVGLMPVVEPIPMVDEVRMLGFSADGSVLAVQTAKLTYLGKVGDPEDEARPVSGGAPGAANGGDAQGADARPAVANVAVAIQGPKLGSAAGPTLPGVESKPAAAPAAANPAASASAAGSSVSAPSATASASGTASAGAATSTAISSTVPSPPVRSGRSAARPVGPKRVTPHGQPLPVAAGDEVEMVLLDPAGRYLVRTTRNTSTGAASCRVFETKSGRMMGELRHGASFEGASPEASSSQPKAPRCAAFDPEGRWIVTAGDDDYLRLWDLPSLSPRGETLSTYDRATELAVGADEEGRTLIAALGRQAVVWRLNPREVLSSFTPSGPTGAAATGAGGGTAFGSRGSGGGSGGVAGASGGSGLQGTGLQIGPNGRTLLVGNALFDTATGARSGPPLDARYDQLRMAADGTVVAYQADSIVDPSPHLLSNWRPADANRRGLAWTRRIDESYPTEKFRQVFLSTRDTRHLVRRVLDANGKVLECRLVDGVTGRTLVERLYAAAEGDEPFAGDVDVVAVSADGALIVAADNVAPTDAGVGAGTGSAGRGVDRAKRCLLHRWSTASGRPKPAAHGEDDPGGNCTWIEIDPAGGTACVGVEGGAAIWELDSGRIRAERLPLSGARGGRFVGPGRLLGYTAREVVLFRFPEGRLSGERYEVPYDIHDVAVDPTGERIAVLTDRRLHHLDAALRKTDEPVRNVNAASLLFLDSNLLAVGCLDGAIRLWDVDGGSFIHTTNLPTRSAGVWGVAVDGRLWLADGNPQQVAAAGFGLHANSQGYRLEIPLPQPAQGSVDVIQGRAEAAVNKKIGADGLTTPLSLAEWEERRSAGMTVGATIAKAPAASGNVR